MEESVLIGSYINNLFGSLHCITIRDILGITTIDFGYMANS